jgi:hypothetical protein
MEPVGFRMTGKQWGGQIKQNEIAHTLRNGENSNLKSRRNY